MARRSSPAMIALSALMIPVTFVLTYIVHFPTPAGGYANLSDVAVTFVGLAFGPWVGLIAGGLGTAASDLIGFPSFAPLTLVAHGLEGLIIGLIGWRRRSVAAMLLAWLVGSAVMVLCYLVGEGLFLTQWPAALLEVPLNVLQAAIGALVGIPLVVAVRRAYPPIDRLGQPRTWTE